MNTEMLLFHLQHCSRINSNVETWKYEGSCQLFIYETLVLSEAIHMLSLDFFLKVYSRPLDKLGHDITITA